MLEIEGIDVFYDKVQALKGVSVRVAPGQIVTLLGANGAGKSTTLRAISGLIPLACGRIRFEGEDITRLPPEAIVARGISHVPEGRDIFSDFTVFENLLVGAHTRSETREIQRNLERVMQVFPILGERRRQLAGTLSGGEQQMLAIGRALMASPRVMLLDEPSLGLAPLLVRDIFRVVREVNAAGVTILLVEQNVRLALQVAGFGYVLETGRVALRGPSGELAEDPRIRQAYMGMRTPA